MYKAIYLSFVLVEVIFVISSVVSHAVPCYFSFLLGKHLCLSTVQFSVIVYSRRKLTDVLTESSF